MKDTLETISLELTHADVRHIIFSLVDVSEEFEDIRPQRTQGLSEKGINMLCDRIGAVIDDMEGLKGSIKKSQTVVSLPPTDLRDIAKCLWITIERFDEFEPELQAGYTKQGLQTVAAKLIAKITG